MTEWLKILISALAGMATGILLEPCRHLIANKITAHCAKRAIYAELGKIYWCGHNSTATLGGNLTTEAFDYYYQSKRDILYLLPEFQELILHCELITSLRTAWNHNAKDSTEVWSILLRAFEYRIKHKLLDVRELDRQAKAFDKTVQL